MALGDNREGAQLQGTRERCRGFYRVFWVNEIQECSRFSNQLVTLTSGSFRLLGCAISRRLLVLGLAMMPAKKLIFHDQLLWTHSNYRLLFLEAQYCASNPTTPTQDPPMLLPSSSRTRRQLQKRMLWMLTPAVPKQLPSNGAGRHQQWVWSDAP